MYRPFCINSSFVADIVIDNGDRNVYRSVTKGNVKKKQKKYAKWEKTNV